jgi:hypothetical protein
MTKQNKLPRFIVICSFWRLSNFVMGVGVIHLLVVDSLVVKEKTFIEKVPCV